MPRRDRRRNDLSHLAKPQTPELQTSGKVLLPSVANLAPNLHIDDTINLRSAGPCYLRSVSRSGQLEVEKVDGSRRFILLFMEFRAQFLGIAASDRAGS